MWVGVAGVECRRPRAALPASLEAFRGHPRFCLERHLGAACARWGTSHHLRGRRAGASEALYPREAMGEVKGESVYLRAHVKPVHTKVAPPPPPAWRSCPR